MFVSFEVNNLTLNTTVLLAYFAFISTQIIILETFTKSNPIFKPFKVGTFPPNFELFLIDLSWLSYNDIQQLPVSFFKLRLMFHYGNRSWRDQYGNSNDITSVSDRQVDAWGRPHLLYIPQSTAESGSFSLFSSERLRELPQLSVPCWIQIA